MGKHRVQAFADGSGTVRRLSRKAVANGRLRSRSRFEQRPDFPHLSLSLSLNLLLTLADFFSSLLSGLFDLWQGQESGMCGKVGSAK